MDLGSVLFYDPKLHIRICVCCTFTAFSCLFFLAPSYAPLVPGSVLDESPWGVQAVQVWAMYHPVARTELGEVSTCAQLRATLAQGG